MMRSQLCVLIVLLVPMLEPNRPIQMWQDTDQADQIISEITAVRFGRARSEWRGAHPAAVWREFRGNPIWQGNREPFYPWPEGMWCAVAADPHLAVERQAAFYASRPTEPLDCRLEQLAFETSEGAAPDLFDRLLQATTRRFGRGYPNEQRYRLPDLRRLRQADALVQWYQGTFMVYVYRADGKVGVMARTHWLAEILGQVDWIHALQDTVVSLKTTAARLEARYPDIADLLRDLRAPAAIDQQHIVAAARTLLEDQRRAEDRETRAFLADAADHVIRLLYLSGEEPPSVRPELAPLRPFNLEFTYDAHGDSWKYAGGLSEAVRRRYPDTTVGQRLQVYWVLSGGVSECESSFEQVVTEGRRWLDANPTSRYRLAVTAAVAQAYETWWSVGMAPEHDDLVGFDTAAAAEGFGKARLEAIRWYERVINEAPALSPMVPTERRLMHLKLGVDTAQRRYFCAIP